MNRYLSHIAAIVMMCLLPQAANAAKVVETYRFDAQTEGPVSSFTGTTTVEIDDDGGPSNVLAFDLVVGDQVFTAANVALMTVFDGRILVFQPIIDGAVGMRLGYDSFSLIFDRQNTDGTGVFGYSLASDPGEDGFYGYKHVSIELIQAAVPEPATWAMMILGLAAVGATLRRRSPRLVAVSG